MGDRAVPAVPDVLRAPGHREQDGDHQHPHCKDTEQSRQGLIGCPQGSQLSGCPKAVNPQRVGCSGWEMAECHRSLGWHL